MITSRTTLFTTLAIAGLASAQYGLGNLGLSPACDAAIDAAISNQEISKCLNILNYLPILALAHNTTIIPPVNSWLAGVCAADPCSVSTLQTVSSNITTQCAGVLDAHGLNSTLVANIVAEVVSFYPSIRKIACLEESSNSTLCVTQLLDDVQALAGTPLTINEIVQIPKLIQTTGIPKNITCNACTQAAWAIVESDAPQLAAIPPVAGAVSNLCGAAFASASPGVLPTGIIEGTGTFAPTSTPIYGDTVTTPNAGRRNADSINLGSVAGVAMMTFITMFA